MAVTREIKYTGKLVFSKVMTEFNTVSACFEIDLEDNGHIGYINVSSHSKYESNAYNALCAMKKGEWATIKVNPLKTYFVEGKEPFTRISCFSCFPAKDPNGETETAPMQTPQEPEFKQEYLQDDLPF